jgi:antitoxin (DNA-binding transcriptional repressor) of toxin-antitoxin stability system
MHKVGAFEAKNRLGALLDRVENGEEIVITRRGKPVAKAGAGRAGLRSGKGSARRPGPA